MGAPGRYVCCPALLRFQRSGMIEGYRGAAIAQEWAVRDELTAKAAAFASEVVRELWQQSARAFHEWELYVEDSWPEWASAEEDAEVQVDIEKDPQFRRLRQASATAGKQLAEQIRVELDVIRQRGPRRLRLSGNSQLSGIIAVIIIPSASPQERTLHAANVWSRGAAYPADADGTFSAARFVGARTTHGPTG